METVILAVPCFIALAFYCITRPGMRRSGLYLPDFFIVSLAAYWVGAAWVYFSAGYEGADAVTLMAEIALLSACTGTIIGSLLLERQYPNDYVQQSLVKWRFGPGEQLTIYAGLIVSAIVCALFAIGVLLNSEISVLLSEVMEPSSTGNSNLLRARKAITNSTEGYFAPGFVKQFRDIIVPILLSAITLIATRKPLKVHQVTIVLITSALAFIAMVLTGVRSNLFLLFITLFVARMLSQRVPKPVKRGANARAKGKSLRPVILAIVAVVIYGILTILLGRVSEEESSMMIVAFDVLANLFDRLIVTVPRENITSYVYWITLGPSYGSFWLADLSGILPGVGSPGLSNLLHEVNGGSIQGHSSMGLPVDVWLNWGWLGLLIVPMCYGLFLNYFDCLLATLRSPIAFGIKVMLALAVLKIYTPFGFILYGGMMSVMLYIWLSLIRGSDGPWRPAGVPGRGSTK